ncbi:hypothetical protein EIP91_008364 [Steccherinum ochraceum]|uniref:NADP-dependent oxidoreductase domain-containing protein n=1 Tax=Steccherinum ochraceum TaxID=92696 RepID=A0A4R0RD24_9APHY|nr:hypothetical protein EIP91_008364 [Steccherinum ochraceum]
MVPVFTLNNGSTIPAIGLGSFMGKFGDNNEEARKVVGYRHIDTAAAYGTEAGVGAAIRNSGVSREEIYVVTKLAPGPHAARVKEAFEESLAQLNVGYIDLYLMHWPQSDDPATGRTLQPDESPNFVDTWKAMEKLLDTGKVKSIGVSNFSVKLLEILLAETTIIPAVNQIEVHPLYPQFSTLEFCKSKGIVVTAYSPFGAGQKDLIEHPTLQEIGSRTHHSATQITMGWLLKKGVSAVPKSATHVRMVQNLKYAELSAEDETKIDDIHKAPGMHRMVWGFMCVDGKINGWTYEQLGWPLTDGGFVQE